MKVDWGWTLFAFCVGLLVCVGLAVACSPVEGAIAKQAEASVPQTAELDSKGVVTVIEQTEKAGLIFTVVGVERPGFMGGLRYCLIVQRHTFSSYGADAAVHCDW